MAIALSKSKLERPALGSLLGRLKSPFASRSNNLALGLDIGSHAVKICELRRLESGYQLESLGSAMIPLDSIEDGTLINAPAVAAVIEKLLTNLRCRHKKVAISVSGYSVIVKKINLRLMSPEELAKHVQHEAEQYIPFDIDDVYLDCQDLHTNVGDEDRSDVMLAAARKELVDGYLNMLDGLGLQSVVVDVDAFALENAFELGPDQHENVALVDIGAAKMNINILSDGTSALVRDVPLGGRQLTEQIQQALDLSFEEAEEIKLGHIAPAPESKARVAEIMLRASQQWSKEIQRALDFYQTGHVDHPISRIIISGGGAKIAGLAEFFSQECSLPCSVLDPFAQTKVDGNRIDPAYLRAIAPEMAQAVGLATRTIDF